MGDDHPNALAYLRTAEAFRRGDLDAVASLVAADVVWHVPGDHPLAGDWVGRDQVLQRLARLVSLGFTLREHDVFGDDDHVCALSYMSARRDGLDVETRVVSIFHFRDGRQTERWLYPDDPAAWNRIFGGSPAGPGGRRGPGGRPRATALPPAARVTSVDAAAAVDRIKRRFQSAGPTARIPLLRGGSFTASVAEGGITVSNLAKQPFLPWAVFGEAVTLLGRMGGHASRGDAMKCKLGDDGLSLDSVEGHIAAAVYGQRMGESVFRRITPVACILIWAGVCGHTRGELVLRG